MRTQLLLACDSTLRAKLSGREKGGRWAIARTFSKPRPERCAWPPNWAAIRAATTGEGLGGIVKTDDIDGGPGEAPRIDVGQAQVCEIPAVYLGNYV